MKQFLLLCFLILAGCATPPPATYEVIDEVYLYGVLSANVYCAETDKPFKLPRHVEEIKNDKICKECEVKDEYKGSGVFTMEGDMQAKVFEVMDNNNVLQKIIIAYRGTERGKNGADIICGTINKTQRKSAKKFYKEIENVYRCQGVDIHVTGHSLGGALAMEASLAEGVNAYVFNPSFRIDNKDNIYDSNIISIEEKGDLVPKLFIKRPDGTKPYAVNYVNNWFALANNNHDIINMVKNFELALLTDPNTW